VSATSHLAQCSYSEHSCCTTIIHAFWALFWVSTGAPDSAAVTAPKPEEKITDSHTAHEGVGGGADDMFLTEYEKERAAQIARNKALLAELQLPELAASLGYESSRGGKHHERAGEKGIANKR